MAFLPKNKPKLISRCSPLPLASAATCRLQRSSIFHLPVRQQENLARKNSPRDGSVSPTFQITELLRERYPFLAGSVSLKITCRGPASRTFHGRSADGIDRLRSRLA